MKSKHRDFRDISIKEIIKGYAEKTITPAEVAEMCIKRVVAIESKCLAWEVFSAEKLRKSAKETEDCIKSGNKPRPLEGIPVGIKDIFNTADFATEMGSPLWKDFTPGNDARVVFYLKQAGALIPGKTVTAEFAVHTLGKTLNPHDATKTPGTSSSGSAVAVATGMIPAALGTQTAGSIVRPASFCGCYGIKPSFGLLPRTGSLKTTDSLDSIGYFVTHLEDARTFFDVIRVHGDDYPISNAALTDEKRQNKPKNKPWKIAFVKTHTWKHAHPYAQEAITKWVEKLSKDSGIDITATILPEEIERAHTVHSNIYDKTLSYYFKEEFKKKELVSPIMNEIIERGNKVTVKEYQDGLLEQEVLARKMDEFLQEYDIVVSLSTAGEAPPREEIERPDPALIWTLAHVPVISAPVFTSPKGMPFGAQIVSRRYNDYLLFNFADYLSNKGLIPKGPNPQTKI